MIKIIECPRDAMQGIAQFIPTNLKVKYINQLLKVGFDTIDFGSFVSAKAIPQMKDTEQVLQSLDLATTTSKLLAIVANTRGGVEAARWREIAYLGFPLSLSETFQRRNTNKSIAEALNTLNELLEICGSSKKELVVYLSMGFGNPYGDLYDLDMVVKFSDILKSIGVRTISLADTVGVATADQISDTFKNLKSEFNASPEFGVHLHSNPISSREKIEAAYAAGCRRFDGALLGFGGCPMAKDELVGNIDTLDILNVLDGRQIAGSIDKEALHKAKEIAQEVFS